MLLEAKETSEKLTWLRLELSEKDDEISGLRGQLKAIGNDLEDMRARYNNLATAMDAGTGREAEVKRIRREQTLL